MRPIKVGSGLFVLGLSAFLSAGCFLAPEITGGLKIANNQLSQLTAEEIKALNLLVNNAIKQQNPGANPVTLTDQQAAALANFFAANNINSEADLNAVGQAAEQGTLPQGLDQLAAAFGNIDPNNVTAQDLQNIFNNLNGA